MRTGIVARRLNLRLGLKRTPLNALEQDAVLASPTGGSVKRIPLDL